MKRKKKALLVSRHVQCNSLDDYWPLLTKIIILIMWEYFLIDVHVSLGDKNRKEKAKFYLVPLIIYNLQFTLRFFDIIILSIFLVSLHLWFHSSQNKKKTYFLFLVNIYVSDCITHPCSFMSLYQTDFSRVSLYALFSHGSCSVQSSFFSFSLSFDHPGEYLKLFKHTRCLIYSSLILSLCRN